MDSSHAKSPCCRAKIYRFGFRRRQCSQCKRTWSIRRKKQGRKHWRPSSRFLDSVLLEGRTLKSLAQRAGLTHQALSYRFRHALSRFVSQHRALRVPVGPLVLLIDGLYFRFNRQPWVLYLMALKPCHQNYAVFLDPLLFAGRENLTCWLETISTIPPRTNTRIQAVVSDQIRGITSLAADNGWVLQLCHFHLISQLQGNRGVRKRTVKGRNMRELCYQLTRQALELPDGRQLQRVLDRLKELVRRPGSAVRTRMVVREFLRRTNQFRAYRQFPNLSLPTTTGTVEAMGRIIRDLMRQTRSIRTPHALQIWATALIRRRPMVMCNGKHFQQKKFV